MRDSVVFEEEEMSTGNEKQQQNDTIIGFSISFSQNLLRKLKELDKQDRVLKESKANAIAKASDHGYGSSLTNIASCVIEHLCNQIKYPLSIGTTATPTQIELLIETAEEFLYLFQVQ